MLAFKISSKEPVSYHFTGKFESPSPNWVHQQDILTDYELIVVTKDVLYMQYDQDRFTVKEGDMLLLPPKEAPHNIRVGYKSSNCSFYWLHFQANHALAPVEIKKDGIINTSDVALETPIYLPCNITLPTPEKVIVLMKQLQDAVRQNYSPAILNYFTTIVLCEIHQQFSLLYNQAAQEKKTQKQVYHDIIDYVKRNATASITVSDIALQFGYNEKYLSHLFSSLSGIPLKQFILKCKIDEANFLLTDTNQSIADIATAIGFHDSHNFMKCYKKITGLTPTEYRNAFSQRMLFHV